MNLRLLSIAVILALASASVPLRGGKFATETDLLYTVQEVNERERFYFEAELGCNLQCTNHCIEVQEGNALANCINYCGCSALMSAQPLSAYKLDVYYPDGSAQTFNVNEPGNDFALVFTNPDENSLGVSKVDYVDPSNDFTVVVGEENKGRTSSQYAGFQGSQPEEFAYLTHETTEVPNGWDEKTSFGTTEFNYDVSSQGRVKESKNQVDFTYNETGVGSDGHGFNTQF